MECKNIMSFSFRSLIECRDVVIGTSSYLMEHSHGKDMTYIVHYADGRSETLLSVPHYDFNWQITYELAEPMLLPKGTRLEVIAHYDNSPNNKFNPDPTQSVKWGDQTWEEMMIGFFGTVQERRAGVPTAAQQ